MTESIAAMSRQNFQQTTIRMLAGFVLLGVATSPFWTLLLVKNNASLEK